MLKLRTGNLDDKDWENIARATGPLSKAKIYIDDTAGGFCYGNEIKMQKT